MEDWKDKPLNKPFRIPASREGSIKNNESEIILLKKRAKELLSSLEQKSEFLVPSGSISMFAGSQAPESWLLCDGSTVSRTDYANLFAVIGTSYGAGDGSTTFGLPDLRQRFPRGAGSSGSVGGVGGSETHTHDLTIEEGDHAHTHEVRITAQGTLSTQPAHGHSVSIPSSGGGTTGITDPINRFGRATGALDTPGVQHTHSTPNHTHTVNQSNSGEHSHSFTGSQVIQESRKASEEKHEHLADADPANHLPPYVEINYIIKA